MNRRGFLASVAASCFGAAYAQTAAVPPAALIYYAGQAGRLTSDRDKAGGNPFATALVEVLQQKPLTLKRFTERMAIANQIHSHGWQMMDYPRVLPETKARLDKGAGRVALVLINADYSKSDAYSLPGARFDAKRVPEALTAAGFATTLVLDATAATARKALEEFAKVSETADASLIYIGGHGAQRSRDVYWLAGDFPGQDPKWLDDHAVTVAEIAKAAKARELNLVLYASCRDNPFS
jgi:Caspase domain